MKNPEDYKIKRREFIPDMKIEDIIRLNADEDPIFGKAIKHNNDLVTINDDLSITEDDYQALIDNLPALKAAFDEWKSRVLDNERLEVKCPLCETEMIEALEDIETMKGSNK
jgi:hypothetical protein